MKKCLLLICTFLIVACGNSVSLQDIAEKLPDSTDEKKSLIFKVPSSNSFSTDIMYIGMLKTIGSEQPEKLAKLLSLDNINIGIAGNNSIVNKAVVISALEKVDKVGKNIDLYMFGTGDDQAELEQLAKKKEIKLHYFLQK